MEQGEESLQRQAQNEAAWKLEKLEREAKYAKDALESKQLAEKEIAAAKAAKRAAEKALKFAKKQVEDRVRKEAEEKAAEERQKILEDYRKLTETYEAQIAAFERLWQEGDDVDEVTPTPLPLRTTCISEGERRIEISEFTQERLEPLITGQLSSTGLFDNRRVNGNQLVGNPARRSLLHDNRGAISNGPIGTGTPQFPTSNDAARTANAQHKTVQPILLLPSHLERTAPMTTSMQSSLQASGLLSTFDNVDYEQSEALIGSDNSIEQVVHSTVFWEPPTLSVGSELLNTLRRRRWQAFYARKSGRLMCKRSIRIHQLISRRCRSHIFPWPPGHSCALLPARISTTTKSKPKILAIRGRRNI